MYLPYWIHEIDSMCVAPAASMVFNDLEVADELRSHPAEVNRVVQLTYHLAFMHKPVA
jgi:hypothetical protein